jgi:hypothetical protein
MTSPTLKSQSRANLVAQQASHPALFNRRSRHVSGGRQPKLTCVTPRITNHQTQLGISGQAMTIDIDPVHTNGHVTVRLQGAQRDIIASRMRALSRSSTSTSRCCTCSITAAAEAEPAPICSAALSTPDR